MSIIGAQLRGITYLAIAKKGKYSIIDIPTGRLAGAKCMDRGIIPGRELEVINNDKLIPIIVTATGGTYAIGRGLALKIMVKPIKS